MAVALGVDHHRLDVDPEQLARVLARQAELKSLTRKYAADVDGVIAWAEDARQRLAGLDTSDGGWTWIVRASETALLTPVHAARARARFTSLASRHGAEYEGWEAAAP